MVANGTVVLLPRGSGDLAHGNPVDAAHGEQPPGCELDMGGTATGLFFGQSWHKSHSLLKARDTPPGATTPSPPDRQRTTARLPSWENSRLQVANISSSALHSEEFVCIIHLN